MSNETKRDVFDEMKWELIRNLANTIDQNGGLRPVEDATKVWENYATRYTDAIPDDLPTLPRIIGEYLKDSKLAHNGISFLFQVGNHAMSDYRIAFENWAFTGKSFDEYEKGDTFASAWVLGAWCVEETGEIVKLEAEE